MKVQNFLEATNEFNPKYYCFFEKYQKKIPLSHFIYDKGHKQIVLHAVKDSKPLRLQELIIICRVIDANTPILIKLNDHFYPFFGFKIVDLKKIIFA